MWSIGTVIARIASVFSGQLSRAKSPLAPALSRQQLAYFNSHNIYVSSSAQRLLGLLPPAQREELLKNLISFCTTIQKSHRIARIDGPLAKELPKELRPVPLSKITFREELLNLDRGKSCVVVHLKIS